MKEISFAAVLAFALPCLAQQDTTSGVIPGSDFSLRYETRLEPAGPMPVVIRNRSFSGTRADIVFERFLTDSSRKTYFGYRVQAMAPEAGYSMVTFSRLPITPELAASVGMTSPQDWTYLGLNEGTTKLVRVGDVLELELLRNPQTGQKLVERITVQPTGLTPPSQSQRNQVHDFTPDDLELYFSEPKLLVNGVEEPLFGLPRLSAKPVVVSIKGKGSYSLSLGPEPEFIKAGEVSGNSLSFKIGSDTIVLFSTSRIASGRGRYNLYVRYDPRALVPRSSIGTASMR